MKNYNPIFEKNHRLAGTSTRFALVLPLFALLFLSTFAHADYVLFYAGDFNASDPNANALANENDAIVGGSPYGAATYQNFIIPAGHTWNIQSLFTNNLAENINPTSAYYEIRTNLSEGNGGTPLFSGTASGSDFTWTPTLRNGFGLDEYQAHVHFSPGITLGPGLYWMSVVPQAPSDGGRSYNSNTFDCFASSCIGSEIDDQQYWDSAFFGAHFTNANNEGVFQRFSSGVDGYADVPEPSTMLMLGSGLLGLGGLLRRQLLG